ncbi:MAG: transposase [Bacteroidaceae bacterium]|nr:transposase [Bacteroidaceae bacterium]
MASTLVKIDIHLIFHTKNTGITMRNDDLERIFAYIGGIIRNLGSIAIEVGGMPDHVHILTSLPKTMTLADFVRTIKAESSKWIKVHRWALSSFCMAGRIWSIFRQSIIDRENRAVYPWTSGASQKAFVSRRIQIIFRSVWNTV